MSTGQEIDGLWVGASVEASVVARTVERVEEALALIKVHDQHRYLRVLQDLSRIWVRLLPGSAARFSPSARACELDTRFVLDESVSTARIACAIIHEATHARLAKHGIAYDEARRRRIELVCRRQELKLAERIPDTGELQEHLHNWLTAPPDSSFWTNSAMAQARIDGVAVGLVHLGVPRWAVAIVLVFLKPIRWLRGAA